MEAADKKKKTVDYWRLVVLFYGVILAILNFIRIFDNNFWGDEAYTIRLSKMNFFEMLGETAADVHPPLYYTVVQIVCRIFGYTGEVYHFVSLLPYLIILAVALTIIWKRFGMHASIILITLCSLLETAVNYNVEVRMYSWGAMFMLLSFLALFDILNENQVRSYILFVCFSLAGAYTHYYCLISVAFFYLILLIWSIIKRKDYLKKTLIACGITIILYLPWFFVLLTTFKRTVDDFWMTEIPYIKDCFSFLFQGKLEYVWFILMILAAGVAIWYQRKEPAKVVWWIAGFSSIFGTILVGNLVSRLVRPVFIVRYLYPVAIIAWLMLAVGIASCKKKNIYLIVVIVLLLITTVPGYYEIYQSEKAQNELMESTLEASSGIVSAGDIILTDSMALDWTVADYYYPGTEQLYIGGTELPEPEDGKAYWLFIQNEFSPELCMWIEECGYTCVTVFEDGSLGTNPMSIYRLIK